MEMTYRSQWITALESGTYAQGRGNLRGGDRYCVLGVMCDLFKDIVHGTWVPRGKYYSFEAFPRRYTSVEFLLDLVGVPLDQACALTSMNDRGATFRELAAYLRSL